MAASKDEQKKQKEAALAAALRDNLKRRKVQSTMQAQAHKNKDKPADAAS